MPSVETWIVVPPTSKGPPSTEIGSTEIVFEFEAQGDDTIVRFDHLGWPDMSDRFRDCSMSWAYFLESLKSLIEEGRGTPESVAPACDNSPGT